MRQRGTAPLGVRSNAVHCVSQADPRRIFRDPLRDQAAAQLKTNTKQRIHQASRNCNSNLQASAHKCELRPFNLAKSALPKTTCKQVRLGQLARLKQVRMCEKEDKVLSRLLKTRLNLLTFAIFYSLQSTRSLPRTNPPPLCPKQTPRRPNGLRHCLVLLKYLSQSMTKTSSRQ